jgi:hypothetical protein
MADNTELDTGAGGDTIRTLEDSGGVKWPVGATAFCTTVGTPDVLSIVTPAAGLPVAPQTGSTWAVTQSGTWSVTLPTGAATAALQTSQSVILAAIAAAQLPDSHNVTVDNASLAVTGTFWQATQPVSGPLTDAQLRAVAVPVSGTVAVTGTFWQATQPVSLASVPSHDVTNAGTFAVQAAQSGVWNVTNISGTVSLPTGAATEAKQDTQITALQIMDDWDESDRAKVNPIAGQAGVQGGSGTTNALTQRVVLATDVALPTGTNTLGKLEHTTTGLGHGVTTVTTAGTDVALAASTAAKWVIIQAQTDNTSSVAVGATGVDATVATGTGILLAAGEAVTLMIDNLADVFIDSLVNGEGVRYSYGV